MLLSIGLMVKNESKHLDQCLQSLTPILADLDAELIIVDTGSTDNTVEIAKRYTDKVYYHEWFDDFAGMRNIVLGYCTGEWFFYLDGDEVLEDPSGIIRFFKSGQSKKYNAAFIDMKNPFSERDSGSWGLFQALRFFRKDKGFHFKGIIHEQPQAKGPVAHIEGSIVHYGYVSDDKALMEYKFQRNVALIKKVLEKEPNNIYHLYQLSQSYGMYGKHREALEPIERAYRLAKTHGLEKYMNVVNHLAATYFNNKMYKECEVVCKEGLKAKDGYIDLYYLLAMSQTELGKYEEALTYFNKYLLLLRDYESGKAAVDLSMAHRTMGYSERVFTALCGIHSKLGNYNQAVDYAARIKTPELVKRAVPHWVDACLNQKDIQAIRKLYVKWCNDDSILHAVESAIESKWIAQGTDQKREIWKVFADVNTPYGLLNQARSYCVERADDVPLEFWQKISEIDLRRKENYYGDIVRVFLAYGRSVTDLLTAVRNEKITAYFKYLFGIHNSFVKEFIAYFKDDQIWETSNGDAQVFRIKTAVLYAALQQDAWSEKDYAYLWSAFLDVGIKYVEKCYNPSVLESMGTSWAKTDVDEFLFIMHKVLHMDKNSVDYVQCLRQGLTCDPKMRRGIELLLKEVQVKSDRTVQDEFNELKKEIQEAIKKAINNADLETAVYLINEYEEIAGIDPPLCSAKGIVCMINGKFEEAESIFLSGLQIEPDNPDLLYNLGYLKEVMGAHREAFDYYSKAFQLTPDAELRDEISQAFSRISCDTAAAKLDGFNQADGDLIEHQIIRLKSLLRKEMH